MFPLRSDVLRLATPLTTFTAVLLHAVLGCCVHHVHAGEALGHGSVPHAVHSDHDHGPPAGGCDDHEPGGGDHGDGGCHESDCSWLTAAFVAPPVSVDDRIATRLDAATGASGSTALRDARGDAERASPGGPVDRLRTRVFLL